MKEELSNFLKRNFPFNTDGIQEFLDSFSIENFSKGSIILQPNSIDRKLKFIKSGYIREYYATDEKEININFYNDSQFATDLTSFTSNTKTNKWQQCLTDVVMLTLPKKKFEEILTQYECAHSAIQISFQRLLSQKESLEHDRATKTTKELYEEIRTKKPEWLNNIAQYHIASYLNITPESLSRLRKNIY